MAETKLTSAEAFSAWLAFFKSYIGEAKSTNDTAALDNLSKELDTLKNQVESVRMSIDGKIDSKLSTYQQKIKIVSTAPTAESTAGDPEGTIYLVV